MSHGRDLGKRIRRRALAGKGGGVRGAKEEAKPGVCLAKSRVAYLVPASFNSSLASERIFPKLSGTGTGDIDISFKKGVGITELRAQEYAALLGKQGLKTKVTGSLVQVSRS